jgi:hypothetical protein
MLFTFLVKRKEGVETKEPEKYGAELQPVFGPWKLTP